MTEIRESFALPVYVHIMSRKRIFIHIEPTPLKLYKLIPIKQEPVVIRSPRQWVKEVGVKVKNVEVSICFFYTEGGK